MRVCEPVIVEGTAPKKNLSESGRSKASGGFRQKPGHDLIDPLNGCSRASLEPTAWFEALLPPVLSRQTLSKLLNFPVS